MQIGDCPYEDCNALMTAAMPDQTPCFGKYECEECGRVVWLHHSRLNPEAYTEEGFHAYFDLNEETRSITKRAATPT